MPRTSTYRRDLAAIAIVAYVVLSVLSVALQPQLGNSAAARLDAIAAAGPPAMVSAVAFVLAQLPLIVGLLGVAHLLRTASPGLGTTAATIGVAGAFAHTVAGSILLTEALMAGDVAHRAAFADFVGRLDQSPVMLFSLVGLAGTVVGLLLLGIALWRSHLVPRWVPVVLWVFLVVEFVGSAISPQASYLSSLCGLAAFGGMAVAVRRSPRWSWAVADRSVALENAAAPAAS